MVDLEQAEKGRARPGDTCRLCCRLQNSDHRAPRLLVPFGHNPKIARVLPTDSDEFGSTALYPNTWYSAPQLAGPPWPNLVDNHVMDWIDPKGVTRSTVPMRWGDNAMGGGLERCRRVVRVG
jgi:hypothetical protein